MAVTGIVSKRLGSRYRSGRSTDWLKFKNPAARAVRREAEEDWDGEGSFDIRQICDGHHGPEIAPAVTV
jgi:hypothetical protein